MAVNPVKENMTDADKVLLALKEASVADALCDTRGAGIVFMKLIESSFDDGNFSVVNLLLQEFNPSLYSVHAILGVIRSTVRARSVLSNWDGAYARAWDDLFSRGENVKGLFVGLPQIDNI